ncbi:MAG TPA: DUF6600 domain-containing protein [Azonexus sp.]
MSRFIRLVGSLLLTLPLWAPLAAQADPPARVGRLAHLEGNVEFRVQRDEAASPATRNWPISSGAVLETGERGRAEVWVDSTALRLGHDSRVDFTTIDDERVLLDVAGGSLGISIMDAEQAADLQLRLPDGRIRFAAPGRYRLDVWPDRSELTTLAGQASIEHDGGRTQLTAGNKATLFADGALRIDDADRPDAFDRWLAERENATLASVSRRHVSPYMTGYQDLDTYGDWRAEQDYGSVWYPRAVAVDWAPYRFGRWAWVAPWGWTWIDAAPWGFAPFHYGRWVLIHGRWAWVPGRRERPVYAPALVAWIGNPGWSVSFGFGSAPAVGWFPLAPHEVYVPHYRYSPTYIRRINITHVHNVTVIDRAVRGGQHEHYVHRASPQAVTVVPTRQLREGRTITERDFRRIDRHELGRAPVATAKAGREWLEPGAEARRPQAADRHERAPGNLRETGRSLQAVPEGRVDRREEADRRPPPANRRELQPERGTERAGQPGERELRRDGRDERRGERDGDGAAVLRRPEAAGRPVPLTPPGEPRRELRDERRGGREVRTDDDGPPALRRQEALSRPVEPGGGREPRREIRAEPRPEPREVMRPPVPRDESRAVRRPEPEPQRPVMRAPEPMREAPAPRGGGRDREPAERHHGGRGGDERGDRGRCAAGPA